MLLHIMHSLDEGNLSFCARYYVTLSTIGRRASEWIFNMATPVAKGEDTPYPRRYQQSQEIHNDVPCNQLLVVISSCTQTTNISSRSDSREIS